MILKPNNMKTKICEMELYPARRFPQRILELYAQKKQRSMAQFQPQGLSDFDWVFVLGL